MSKKKKKGFLHASVKPVETEELAKSIAKDLNIPDRPLTIQELAAIDPLTGEPRQHEPGDVYFDLSAKPQSREQDEREQEEALIDKIDREFDE